MFDAPLQFIRDEETLDACSRTVVDVLSVAGPMIVQIEPLDRQTPAERQAG